MDEALYRRLYEMEDGHWWFRGRRSVIRALLDRAGQSGRARILDAGCGTGRNLQEFAALGDAVGVDPSLQAVDFCRRRGLDSVRQGTIEALPFDDGSFDLLFACDVLEHVDDDLEALRELRRVAAGTASLVVTVPAYAWLWSSHDESHHHRRRYIRRDLTARARAAGWSPAFVTHFNTLLLPPIAAMRLLERFAGRRARNDYEITPGRIGPLLEGCLRAEARAIRGGARLPAGVSIGAVLQAT